MASHPESELDRRPTLLSLCSGVGGLDLGCHMVFRCRTVCMVERDSFAASVCVARMEEQTLDPAPIWDDLKSFDGRPWRGRVDLISAGYPCQPFSVAGKRRGSDDPRHLWPDVKRVIDEVRPRVIVLENVSGHVRKGLTEVLEDLAELGFDAEWGIYTASQAGAPHKRARVFVLAYCRDRGFPVEWTPHNLDRGDASGDNFDRCDQGVADASGDCDQRSREPGIIQRQSGEVEGDLQQFETPDDRLQGMGRSLADARSERLEGIIEDRAEKVSARRGSGTKIPAFPPGPEENSKWQLVDPLLYPALEGEDQKTLPSLRRVAHGSTSLVDVAMLFRVDRLRTLGNSVVPQCAALALSHLAKRATKCV